ncbi:MAG: hypothetical protein ABIS37_11435 [Bacteroidia bacterium]
MNSIKDYSVAATIKSDIPLIKIFPVRATIYFKQKDKFRIVSKGIAILPKQGFMDISQLLSQNDSYSAIASGSELITGTQTQIITILPNSDTTDLILAKLWMDTANITIHKSQITTRSSGTVTIDYTYKTQLSYGLPDTMIFTVDVKKFKIPKGVATDINRSSTKENNPPAKTGKIYIQLSNYSINKGIDDAVFKK